VRERARPAARATGRSSSAAGAAHRLQLDDVAQKRIAASIFKRGLEEREEVRDRPEKSEVTAAKVEIAHIDLFKRVRGKKGVEGISLKVNWQCKSDILYLTECRTKAAKKKADHSTRMLRLSATFGDIAGYTIERDVGGCWLTLSLVSLPQLSAS
jgi:hypothetical protein